MQRAPAPLASTQRPCFMRFTPFHHGSIVVKDGSAIQTFNRQRETTRLGDEFLAVVVHVCQWLPGRFLIAAAFGCVRVQHMKPAGGLFGKALPFYEKMPGDWQLQVHCGHIGFRNLHSRRIHEGAEGRTQIPKWIQFTIGLKNFWILREIQSPPLHLVCPLRDSSDYWGI